MYNKVEILEALEPVRGEPSESLEPTKDYEYMQSIGSGGITDIGRKYMKDVECKAINILYIFFNSFRSYIHKLILNIWQNI